ncbi:MAG: threonine-phosphate decarboxylase CobD [Candidatus Anammoxibacter sp.]
MIDQHGGNITSICSTYGLKPEDILDFSANINPLGFPRGIEEAVTANIKSILHYPDPHCSELRKLLSSKHSCNETNIIVGNGSTELFYLIPRAISAKSGFLFQPTFTEFAKALKCAGIKVEEVTCNESDSFRIDTGKIKLDGLESSQSNLNKPRLNNSSDSFSNIIFLCSPNNPTGHVIKIDDILDLTKRLPDTLVVVDEAFMEFTTEPERFSVISYASGIENLIVVRSLTKLYGIPGIRLGFLVAHHKTVDKLLTHKEPWSVNSIAQFVGKVAINDDEFVIKSREYTNNERVFLYNELRKLNGIHVFEPSVNFILIKITEDVLTAAILYERLIKFGIVIRNCSNFVNLSDKYFRVAVRKHDENIRLLEALGEVISNW